MIRKRLFFDIETSPNIGLFWKPGYKLSIGYENITGERAIICISYKWAGDKLHNLTWDKDKNDKNMLEKFIKVVNKADEIVAHNGDKFDVKWLRTRCIKFGIAMNPDIQTIDTLKLARSKFTFNSNRLDYIAKYLGVGEKQETGGLNLWKDITINNNRRSLRKMVEYCDNDVVILEKVWDKLNEYVPAKTSIGRVYSDCPECGSEHTVINKYRVSAAGMKRVSLRCTDCGKYHTIPQSKLEINKEFKG